MSGLGPSFMKIWTCESSLRSGCLNADQKHQRCQSSEQRLEFFRHDRNYFLSRLVATDETWLYITMTRRQSNSEWSGGIAAHPTPKNSECKNPLENSHLDFLGSRRHPPQRLSSKGPNYQPGVLHISAGAIEGHFEGKTLAAGRSPKGSFSCTTRPWLTGHLQPRRN